MDRVVDVLTYSSQHSYDFATSIEYDDQSRVLSNTYDLYYKRNSTYFDITYNTTYTYDPAGRIGAMSVGVNKTLEQSFDYDDFSRPTTITNSTSEGFYSQSQYEYKKKSEWEVSSYTSTIGTNTLNTTVIYTYDYDYMGNIISIKGSDGSFVSYEYDEIGQLVRENNLVADTTYQYVYDTAGNIIRTRTYRYTEVDALTYNIPTSSIAYSYATGEWKDRLTAYDGREITYDEVGNPLKYYNGREYTLTWEGRRLTTASKLGYTFEFTYNDEGIRTSKTVNGVEHVYVLNGSQIVAEIWAENILVYFYDTTGAPMGMQYRQANGTSNEWETYWFEKNLQGDVIGVYTDAGVKVITYTYDAWGKCTTEYVDSTQSTTADYNPFKYRGYYYDEDLGFYYLQSRYYDSVVSRFISPDSVDYLGADGDFTSYNLYDYCGNNPVIHIQESISSGSSVIGSSISNGNSSVSMGDSPVGSQSGVDNPSAPWWLSTAVGAIPDFALGMKYLAANEMHSQFAYVTNTRYMHPVMGGTWRWFGKSSSTFGTVSQSAFKQILAGDARAGIGAIAKSIGGVVGLTVLVNFGFNLYENNWQVDSTMLMDTAIDAAIGVGSYSLATGTMSLVAASFLTAGVSLPGIVVIGGVVILGVGFEHLIRAVSGYWN